MMPLAILFGAIILFFVSIGSINLEDQKGADSLMYTIISVIVILGCILFLKGAIS